MENRREFIEMMAARLKELEVEIQKLEAIADKAVAEVKAEYQKQIEELFLKKVVVHDKLSKIQKVSGNGWEDMKTGVELSWEVFEDSVKSALNKSK